MIIIILLTSAKSGPMSITLSGCLGTSGFGNGSYCSKCVRQQSFLGFCRALKWRYDRACVYRPRMVSQVVCKWGTCSPLFKYPDTQFRLVVIVGLGRGLWWCERWTPGPYHWFITQGPNGLWLLGAVQRG